MSTTPTRSPLDGTTAQQLSERFHDVWSTFEAGDLFTPDALFDLNMPVWRFQLQGPDAWTEQLERIHRGGPGRIDVRRTVPTSTGFVAEHEEHELVDGDDLSARRLVLCEVRDGQIDHVIVYCSGEWDGELRARHTAEAPMIRP